MLILCLLVPLVAQAFMPQAGTWVVTSEVNGRPGRGLALDVQNNIFVLQMYAYESSGQPTFYLATGTLANNSGIADLQRFTGGRYLGSAPLSGILDKAVGQVRLRFTSGVAGFIQLPGESEVAISRFNFGYAVAPASLVGYWNFSSIGSAGLNADLVSLSVLGNATNDGNGLVMSSNGLFGCEHQVRGASANTVVCVKINSAGQLLASYRFIYSVNEGEGFSKILGSDDQWLSVRRLTTAGGLGTGIVLREESGSPAVYESILANHIQYSSR